jgi:hypothetical protein
MNQIKIKINKPLKNYKVDTVITVKAGKDHLPIDPYWRNRLKDAEIDNCISIVKKSVQNESKKTKIQDKQKNKPKLGELSHDS